MNTTTVWKVPPSSSTSSTTPSQLLFPHSTFLPSFMTTDPTNPFALAQALMDCTSLGQPYTIDNLLKNASPSSKMTQDEETTICSVCKDEASGRHYGVVACFGCKGFFRRTVRAGKTYTCRYENKCRIDKTGRNVCRSCRLRRCLEVGMEPDAIRPDRDKTGRQKNPRKNILASALDGLNGMTEASLMVDFPRYETNSNDAPDSEDNRTTPSSRADSNEGDKKIECDGEGVLLTLVQIEEICNKLNQSEESLPLCPISLYELILRPSLMSPRTPMMYTGASGSAENSDYSRSVKRLLVLLLDYANTLKPLADLTPDEKIAIVRNCAPSFCLLTIAYRTVQASAPDGCLFLPNGHVITKSHSLIDSLCTDDKRLVLAESRIRSLLSRILDQIVSLIRRLNPTEEEFVALKAILALDPQGPQLSEMAATLLMIARDSVMGALYSRIHSSGLTQTEAANRFGSLLLLVANVSKYGSLSCATMQYCREIGIISCDDGLLEDLLLKDQ